MSKSDEVLKLAYRNNGVVTTTMLKETNVARQYLKILVEEKKLEKVSRGVYILPEEWADEFFTLQSQFKKGIYSKETALFLHDLTDRTPDRFSMTFPNNYNLSQAKKMRINANRAKEEFYSLGIEEVISPTGNLIRVYNMEKSLCDLLRSRSGVETGIIAEAFKRYVASPKKNIPRLSEYAKILKVESKVRLYLEVLL